MFRCRRKRRLVFRPALALIELLMASAIMAMIAGGIAALSLAVQASNQQSDSMSRSLQHGRVAMQRMERALRTATTSNEFPGFAAFAISIGGFVYPDTLVVWQPEGAVSDPEGLPLFNELVVFTPDPSAPDHLLEIRNQFDSRTVPSLTDQTTWQAELQSLRIDPSATRVTLTDLLRTADVGTPDPARGAVRFHVSLRPSDTEFAEFEAATRPWGDLSWPLEYFGDGSGLRQSWCRIELQLVSGDGLDNSADAAIPFFGSAALHYHVKQ